MQDIETLSPGASSHDPTYVTFSGDLNAGGSQVRSRQARFDCSCDCSAAGSGGGASGSGGGGGGAAGGIGSPSGADASSGSATGTGSGPTEDVTDKGFVIDTDEVANTFPVINMSRDVQSLIMAKTR